MSYVLRHSKYRHVFGDPRKAENNYLNVKTAQSTPEGYGIKGNNKFIGLSWQSGGGCLAVIPHEQTGRMPPSIPFISGHSGPILDWDFNPFDDHQVATASDDCSVKIWQIPEGGLTENIHDPIINLSGHQKRVHIVEYHKVAENVVTSASHDHSVKIWDLTKASVATNIDSVFSEVVWSISYDLQGKQFVTTSKDKQARILDPRSGHAVSTWQAHQGAKPAKAVWLGRRDQIITCGFSKQSERQVILWDPRNLEKPIHAIDVDVAAGMFMPMYDEDTSVLFVAGKGDTNIRYYEIADEAPHLFFLNAYASKEPQKGVCRLPKVSGDIMSCEIARVLKLTGNAVEVVGMRVPRKATEFQSDIFPDTAAPLPALTAEEWFSGKNADPKLMSARPGEGLEGAPRKQIKTPFEMAAEIEEKDKRIAELEAKVAELQAKLGN